MPVTIEVDDREILEVLQQLRDRVDDLSPAMNEIVGVMRDASQQAFENEADPVTGEKWEKLSPVTVLMRGGDAHPILQRSGDLARLQTEYGRDYAMVGSPEIYAAMQQFGGITAPNSMIPGKKIPARPFLGLSDEDEREILEILQDHLSI